MKNDLDKSLKKILAEGQHRVTAAQFARIIGVDRAHVSRLIKRGVIELHYFDDLIDVEHNKKRLAAYRHPGHDSRRKAKIKTE
jgi:hypothetical protein